MNKLFSFLLFSFFISNILCGQVEYGADCDESNTCKADVQECHASSHKCVCKGTNVENKDKTDCVAKGAYTGPCKDDNTCTTPTTQQCSSGFCVCATGYVENKAGTDCEQPAAYGADCTSKNCADTQTCDTTTKKCVCASGYKENSAKNGCEKDTSGGSDDNSSFLKTSLLILLGIAF